MIFKRSHNNKSAIVGMNTKDEAVEVSFNTQFKEEAKVTDVYHNEELSINNNQVKMTLPSSEEGGTFILISDQDDREELEVEKPIPENTIRIHYQREDGNYKRSEEHTSELQSRGHLVCRLLLEKKKDTEDEQRRES